MIHSPPFEKPNIFFNCTFPTMNQPDAPAAVDLGTPTAEPVSREELNRWKRGFTPQAEIWNGRLAMIGLSVAILVIVLLRLAS